MKVLRDYQERISKDANDILKRLGFVYLALEVRVGKTAIALNTAHIYGS